MWSINWKHFIIKLHYFFLYGGLVCSHVLLGAAIPMFQMSFGSFKITFLISRFCICISKFALGFIADKHGNIRNIFMILLIVTTLLLFSLAYIPPIEKRAVTESTVTCNKRRDEMVLNLSTYEFDSSCNEEMALEEYPCELLSDCFNNAVLSGNFKLTNNLTNNFGTTAVFSNFRGKIMSNEDCDCLGKNISKFSCSYHFSQCNSFIRITPEYEMYNFWIFVFLYVIAVASTQGLFFLIDAACIEILDRNSSDFGKQRLWGSIGWLIVCLSVGYHSSYLLSELKNRYFIGICVMLGFFLKSMFLLCLCPIEKAQSPIHACKNLKNIFFSIKNAIFLSGIVICGVFSGLLWACGERISWDLYLADHYYGIGYDGFVNLRYTVRYLVQVPFFFFSGWFVKKLGHFCCLIAALVTIALKMGLWSILNNPWLTLPIELLEGVIYAVFSSAMILYAADCAMAGTEATTLGIFEGIYDGLGLGTGLFLAFYVLDRIWIAFVSSMAILSIVSTLTIFYILISRRKAKIEKMECRFQVPQMPNTIPIIS